MHKLTGEKKVAFGIQTRDGTAVKSAETFWICQKFKKKETDLTSIQKNLKAFTKETLKKDLLTV